jgi:glycolate oxidase iron-sulfur subunit
MDDRELSDLTTKCIRCGFCLEACPTFALTGNEMESPRGRIYLVRSALEGALPWQETRKHLELCLGCRACETACPSGVQYGSILEVARERLEQPSLAKKALLAAMTNPALLKASLKAPGKRIPRFFSKEPPQVDKPLAQPHQAWPELHDLPPVRGSVYLLEGCAMRTLFPEVHSATRRLLRRLGYEIRPSDAGCCGALHSHNGYRKGGIDMANALLKAMPGSEPIIVNSAGCGSHLKHLGFDRCLDMSEFFHAEGLTDLLQNAPSYKKRVTYHDACHLAHGQRIESQPRDLLRAIPGIQFAELNEASFCCGSAGIYNITQPTMARALLERKYENIQATGAEIVVSGNPGCHAWIEQAARERGGKVEVLHTAEILERALSGITGDQRASQ